MYVGGEGGGADRGYVLCMFVLTDMDMGRYIHAV